MLYILPFSKILGYKFESETDTEVIAKLIKHLHTNNPKASFRELVEKTIMQLGKSNCWFKILPLDGNHMKKSAEKVR